MDFLAFVDNSLENLVEIVQSTAALEVPDDGLVFDSESVAAERIKEAADYEGVRIRIPVTVYLIYFSIFLFISVQD